MNRELKSLISSMIAFDPWARLSLNEIQCCLWMNDSESTWEGLSETVSIEMKQRFAEMSMPLSTAIDSKKMISWVRPPSAYTKQISKHKSRQRTAAKILEPGRDKLTNTSTLSNTKAIL